MSLAKTLPAWLNPRERVAFHVIAKKTGWQPGRQGTGYEKLDLVGDVSAMRLVRRALEELGGPVLFDAWLLRYPVGSEIPPHTDPAVEGMCHVRLNAIVLASSGGLLYLDGEEFPLDDGDAYIFRPDVVRHQVTAVERNQRLVFSVGANVEPAHAAKLGLA